METKKKLREKYIALRNQMPPEIKNKLDLEIQSRFLISESYRKSQTIFTYVSTEKEIDTYGIIRAGILNSKKVAVPKCNDNGEMDFYYITSFDCLEKGMYNILEPKTYVCKKVNDLSNGVCVVPGFCYDLKGFRVGYGKGYYDRFLKRFKGVAVGLCYSKNLELQVPADENDRKVDILITDNFSQRIK